MVEQSNSKQEILVLSLGHAQLKMLPVTLSRIIATLLLGASIAFKMFKTLRAVFRVLHINQLCQALTRCQEQDGRVPPEDLKLLHL